MGKTDFLQSLILGKVSNAPWYRCSAMNKTVHKTVQARELGKVGVLH